MFRFLSPPVIRPSLALPDGFFFLSFVFSPPVTHPRLDSTPVCPSSLSRTHRSVLVEVKDHMKAKRQLESKADVDAGPAAESASLSSSPTARCAAGAHCCSSSPKGSARGSESSSATEVATANTSAPVTSPLLEMPPGAPHVSQLLHKNDTTMYGAGSPDKDLHRLPVRCTATATSARMTERMTPHAAAIDVHASIGWQSATTAEQQPSARGVAVPAGDPVPELEVFGGESASDLGEMNLTDADLLDVAAVFMGEDGLGEELL